MLAASEARVLEDAVVVHGVRVLGDDGDLAVELVGEQLVGDLVLVVHRAAVEGLRHVAAELGLLVRLGLPDRALLLRAHLEHVGAAG